MLFFDGIEPPSLKSFEEDNLLEKELSEAEARIKRQNGGRTVSSVLDMILPLIS
ncbi:MAG: hypothetical protein LBC77_04510 [Spirochaetaceae bacterium]|jgi:hypothetical protein|nr:hypothetical protein [Spirochaetaceae bacterium]